MSHLQSHHWKVGMGLNFSFIYPCMVPQELTADLIWLGSLLRSPQSLASSGPWGWSSLKETHETKLVTHNKTAWLPGSPCLIIFTRGKNRQWSWATEERKLEQISKLFLVGLHYWIGEGFLLQKDLAPRYNKTILRNSVNFGVSES